MYFLTISEGLDLEAIFGQFIITRFFFICFYLFFFVVPIGTGALPLSIDPRLLT